MSINIPIVNAPNLYVDNLQIAWASNTTLTVAAGAARDSTNANDIILSSSVTINGGAQGAINRLDTGTLAASTRYNVFAVGDSTGNNTAGALLSTSLTAPTLPIGYDMFRRIGTVFTDGSVHFLLGWWYGNGNSRTFYYDVGISELSGGSSATFAALDLATSLPAVRCQAIFDATYTPNGATDVAEFLPFGSAATSGMIRFGYGVAGAQVGMVTVPVALDSGVPKVQYKVTSGDTLTLLTSGYIESL